MVKVELVLTVRGWRGAESHWIKVEVVVTVHGRGAGGVFSLIGFKVEVAVVYVGAVVLPTFSVG